MKSRETKNSDWLILYAEYMIRLGSEMNEV